MQAMSEHRVTNVTFNGTKFRKVAPDRYESVDGQWYIEQSDMESECEGAHPVKITPEMREQIKDCPGWSYEAREAVFAHSLHCTKPFVVAQAA